MSGRLLSALGTPLENLVARAFAERQPRQQRRRRRRRTASRSRCRRTRAYAPSLAVEVEPKPTDAPQPHFWAKPFALTASKDLGDVQLPAYVQPNAFRFPFQGEAAGDPAVVGALVRARTLLADDMTGTTDFLRDGLTDMTGQASLSLLPGSTTALRLYDIAVVPPADSVYATTCLAELRARGGRSCSRRSCRPAAPRLRRHRRGRRRHARERASSSWRRAPRPRRRRRATSTRARRR